MSWTVERCLKEESKLSVTDLEYLKEWLTKQPHLPPISDMQLVTFMHSNEYSLEKTKVCIDKFFTMRTHAPDVFANRDVLLPVNAAQGKFMMVSELPKCDSNGYRVVGLSLQPADDLSEFNAARVAFMAFAMMEVLIANWPTCPGYTFIMDAQNLQLGHLTKSPVSLLKKLLLYVQEAAPLRMRIVHIININSLVEKVMFLIKPFLGEELKNMLQFHSGSMESFYEAIPRDMLPHEFGGTNGSALDYHNELLKRAIEHREDIMEAEKFLVDESRRPGKAKNASEVFGMEGSFKQLSID